MKRLRVALSAALLAMVGWPACPAAGLGEDSLYQLHAQLDAQSGAKVGFDLYRGHPVLIGMFYGSCPATCPLLITGMQVYESHLDEAARARLRVLLVSFDAARDTPRQLDALARLHHADPTRWTFTSAAETDARKIAALLGVRYTRLADGSFDHSSLITLLDAQGRMLASTTKLVGDSGFQARLAAATAADVR